MPLCKSGGLFNVSSLWQAMGVFLRGKSKYRRTNLIKPDEKESLLKLHIDEKVEKSNSIIK
jgi:hypothetical protein